MKNVFTTKRLCRGGVIAALYVALTYAFGSLAFGAFQIRPSEALCILPLFFPEAVPALALGCALSNILSQYSVYDVVFGTLATLVASALTYVIGRLLKKDLPRLLLGGIPPVLCNAFIIPLIIVFLCGDLGGQTSAAIAYFVNVGAFLLTETIWVYALGVPLYYTVKRLQRVNPKLFA